MNPLYEFFDDEKETVVQEPHRRADRPRPNDKVDRIIKLRTIDDNDEANVPKTENVLDKERRIIELARLGQKGDADLLRAEFENKFLFDHTNKIWLKWDTIGLWEPDAHDTILSEAAETLIELYSNVENKLKRDIKLHEKNSKKVVFLKNALKVIQQRIKACTGERHVEGVLKFLRSKLGVKHEDFDKNIYTVNLLNGFFDLKKNFYFQHPDHGNTKMKPRDFLHKKQAAVRYNEESKAPFFEEFLNLIFDNDQEKIKFVLRYLGLSLTGENTDYILFCYGPGGNGKTSLFNVLKMLFDDYYSFIPIDQLVSIRGKYSGNGEYNRAELLGTRIAVASELPKNSLLKTEEVKSLSGNDPITARYPYGRPFTFTPSHSLFMFGNHKPRIDDASNGIWRRMLLLEFGVNIKERLRSKGQKYISAQEFNNEIKKEAPGIFNMLSNGYQEYLKIGLNPPESVLQAGKTYEKDSDSLADFLSEVFNDYRNNKDCVGHEEQIKESLRVVYKEYILYCERNDEARLFNQSKTIAEALRERGFEVRRSTGNKSYVFGITRKPYYDAPDDLGVNTGTGGGGGYPF